MIERNPSRTGIGSGLHIGSRPQKDIGSRPQKDNESKTNSVTTQQPGSSTPSKRGYA